MPRARHASSSAFASVITSAKDSTDSLRSLALKAEIPTRTVARWAAGEEPAALADLERLAGVLGLEIVVRRRQLPGK